MHAASATLPPAPQQQLGQQTNDTAENNKMVSIAMLSACQHASDKPESEPWLEQCEMLPTPSMARRGSRGWHDFVL